MQLKNIYRNHPFELSCSAIRLANLVITICHLKLIGSFKFQYIRPYNWKFGWDTPKTCILAHNWKQRKTFFIYWFHVICLCLAICCIIYPYNIWWFEISHLRWIKPGQWKRKWLKFFGMTEYLKSHIISTLSFFCIQSQSMYWLRNTFER